MKNYIIIIMIMLNLGILNTKPRYDIEEFNNESVPLLRLMLNDFDLRILGIENKTIDVVTKANINNILSLNALDIQLQPRNDIQSYNVQDGMDELERESITSQGYGRINRRLFSNGTWYFENSNVMFSTSSSMTPDYKLDVRGTFGAKLSSTQYLQYLPTGVLNLYGGNFGVYSGLGNAMVYTSNGSGIATLTLSAADPHFNPSAFYVEGFGFKSQGSSYSTGLAFNCDLLPDGAMSLGTLTNNWTNSYITNDYTNSLWLKGTWIWGNDGVNYLGNRIYATEGSGSQAVPFDTWQYGNIHISVGKSISRPSAYAELSIGSTCSYLNTPNGNFTIASDTGCVISTHTIISGNLTVTGALTATVSTATYSLNSGKLGNHTSDYYQIAFDTTVITNIDTDCRNSTGTIQNQVNAIATSTGTIQTQLNSVAVSTGTIQTQINNIVPFDVDSIVTIRNEVAVLRGNVAVLNGR